MLSEAKPEAVEAVKRYGDLLGVAFQMADVAVPKQMFREILSLIVRLRAPPAPDDRQMGSDATDGDGRGAPR